MAVNVETLMVDANCFNCVTPGMWNIIRLALLARIADGNTMTADIATLLAEGGCFACLPPGEQQLIELALLKLIQENGGGGGGSGCVTCSQTVPVLAPDVAQCECSIVFGIGAIRGSVYVWDTTTNEWFPVISGP